MAALTVVVALCMLGSVVGHGYMTEPPSRSSMWRFGFHTPHNYDDDGENCGGFGNQMAHGYKCGICGDPWQGPRHNEAGGKYATGTLARNYTMGQVVPVTVIVTANHKGWFEFKLCQNNNPRQVASQECLDKHVVQLADGSGSKLHIGTRTGPINTKLRLPEGLTCTQCVFQWRYHTGNSWGSPCEDGRHGGLGCGPQEEFYACADVSISVP